MQLFNKTGNVTIQGYREVHIRIGKVVWDAPPEEWSHMEALGTRQLLLPEACWSLMSLHPIIIVCVVTEMADDDWTDDVARFSGDAGIVAWFSKVKRSFQSGAGELVTTLGWKALWSTFDKDGGGTIDEEEFVVAMRTTCGVSEDIANDERSAFCAIIIERTAGIGRCFAATHRG